ncbi:unnamed protein product [Allacma fusca]|uniref:Uncharacterized protein n=1 Tax=Allacma fusca TaxID=39272 RepID=A0A8J2PKC2_9HEXA|nr:unnamed protein product [Allacma fusca]
MRAVGIVNQLQDANVRPQQILTIESLEDESLQSSLVSPDCTSRSVRKQEFCETIYYKLADLTTMKLADMENRMLSKFKKASVPSNFNADSPGTNTNRNRDSEMPFSRKLPQNTNYAFNPNVPPFAPSSIVSSGHDRQVGLAQNRFTAPSHLFTSEFTNSSGRVNNAAGDHVNGARSNVKAHPVRDLTPQRLRVKDVSMPRFAGAHEKKPP